MARKFIQLTSFACAVPKTDPNIVGIIWALADDGTLWWTYQGAKTQVWAQYLGLTEKQV